MIKNDGRFKKGQVPWMKGRKHSEETKEKLREISIRRGARPPSQKGKKYSDEHNKKMSVAQKESYKKNPWRKLKISKALSGSKSNLWKGGRMKHYPELVRLRKSKEYRIWRTSVFERDNYTCIWCGLRGGWNKELKTKIELNADHIKPFADYPELRFAIDNGRTLCVSCHKKTNTYGNNQWKKFESPSN